MLLLKGLFDFDVIPTFDAEVGWFLTFDLILVVSQILKSCNLFILTLKNISILECIKQRYNNDLVV